MSHHVHQNTHPLSGLPQCVRDAVFQQLSLPHLAIASLVCTAWKDVLYEYLPPKLQLQSARQAAGILAAGLHRCRCVGRGVVVVWRRWRVHGCCKAVLHTHLPCLSPTPGTCEPSA